MKKIVLTFRIFSVVMLLSASMFAQRLGGNSLVGLANAAAHSCIIEYRAKGMDIRPVIETTGFCYSSGQFMKKVSFYAVAKCKTNPCPRPFSYYVASVYFDCNKKVIAIECAK